MNAPDDALLVRLRESIGPTVGNPASPEQEEDPQAQQLAGVLRMLASQEGQQALGISLGQAR